MSRGPSRRVRDLVEQGLVQPGLVAAADFEADLLEHPYIGMEHLELALLRSAGRAAEYDALRATLSVGLSRRWWRPRGPRSALRRRGLRQTEAARRNAEQHRRESSP